MKLKNLLKISLIIFIIQFIFISNLYICNADSIQKKIVYLTFDDGPSPNNTDAILDILSKNNVKATFCVIGSNALNNKGTMARLNELNMGIIPHCYKHNYKELYSSTEYYINDLEKCMKAINTTTGKEHKYTIIRMPGGSYNSVSSKDVLSNIKAELKRKNLYYLDWNVDSGDASANQVSTNIIQDNIFNESGSYKIDVVLMHDLENKITTKDSLQTIINRYKDLGYEFKTLNEIEPWEIDYLISKNILNR